MSLTIEQRKARLKGLGGSDVAVALGLSPWRTQLQLWAEKSGEAPPPVETPAMEWGSRLETAIRKKFTDEHPEWDVVPGPLMPLNHPEHRFLQALPDGYIRTNDKCIGIWEGKTSAIDWGDAPPAYYVLQLQHYLYVHDLPMGIISCLFRGREYVEYVIHADHAEYEKHVLPELRKFWTCVKERLPMFEPVDLTELNLVQGGPPDEPEPVVADRKMMELVMRAKTADTIAKDAEKEAKAAKLELGKALGRHKSLVNAEGKKMVTQYQTKDTVILDTKSLLTDQPELLDKFGKDKKGYRAMRLL